MAEISKVVTGGAYPGGAPTVSIKITGMEKVLRNLRGIKGNIGRGAERGLTKAANVIMRESLKIVPVQTGNLKGAWFIEKEPGMSGLKTCIWLGYRGVEYAAWVHEIPGEDITSPVTHGKFFNIKHAEDIRKAAGTWRGTAAGGMFKRKPEEQWKYLETPLRENLDNIVKMVRDEIVKAK